MMLNCKHALEARLECLDERRKVVQIKCDRHVQTDDATGESLGTLYWSGLGYCRRCEHYEEVTK